jgi:hypothetical protein
MNTTDRFAEQRPHLHITHVDGFSRVAQRMDGTWEPVTKDDPRWKESRWVTMYAITTARLEYVSSR